VGGTREEVGVKTQFSSKDIASGERWGFCSIEGSLMPLTSSVDVTTSLTAPESKVNNAAVQTEQTEGAG